jgi:hypothetical protein
LGLAAANHPKVGIVAPFQSGAFESSRVRTCVGRKADWQIIINSSVSVISIIRMKSISTFDMDNVTDSMSAPMMWSILEPELGIVFCNLPVLPPLFPRHFSSWFSRSHIVGGSTTLAGTDANKDCFLRFWGSSHECTVAGGRASEIFEMADWREREADSASAGSQVGILEDGTAQGIMVKTEFRVQY